ncbi:TadE/TadG family type IV pilus assembly protein [Oceaniglobus ichthyenteri]|uniref:TadE/TadG family type IV pilus assembly protein n=1 Tax=Oceaniglobus ichthyenteri TaxID=2136177 RepID=UPI000F84A37A|nr:pilus assembly protein [Oceaniglobus ichthyenteri]
MKLCLRNSLSRFRHDSQGSYSVEAILMLPMLAWAILAMYSYFDGLRLANVNVKAAHTISDILSRETDEVNDAYINGAENLFGFLVNRGYQKSLRISVFRFDGTDNQFDLMWSEGRGTVSGYTQATAGNAIDRLPVTADGDTVITVETWMDYRSAFVMGLTDTTLYNFLVTSPRFAPQLLWEGQAAANT